MLAVRTPEAPQATCTLARPAIPPSPLRDRVGHSDHDRFRGYFPVHFIPAYNLPVYASQWPLPDTTQDSVRGCSLGFTAAAISGDRVQRTCTAQPPQNRTCRITAYRFLTGELRSQRCSDDTIRDSSVKKRSCQTVCPFLEVAHPRCRIEGYPARPGRASYREGEP